MTAEEREKLLELLADKAVYGLSADEQRESDKMSIDEVYRDDLSFELTAAAINLTAVDPAERMPAALRSRILASADEHFAKDDLQPTFEFEPKKSAWTWLGWLVAGAACIALAVNIYTTRPPSDVVKVATPTPSPEKPDARKDFEAMMASAESVKAAFAAMPKAPAELAQVSGDVVWSDVKQAGYMRLRGVPKNDPTKSTYQLWIFDETQSEKTPIDGGVFDITGDGEVIVPIDAKLKAKNPKAFAITVEKPGGVVVSGREKVVTLGAVAKS